MTFEYKDHEADIGIVGIGNTIEQAFEQGAKGMFSLMCNIKKVEKNEQINIKCNAPDYETLFVEWLNELLSKKDLENMFFSEFKIEKIERVNDELKLTAKVFGEKINIKKHEPKIEVKAATYSGLKFKKKDGKYYIQCVVDV